MWWNPAMVSRDTIVKTPSLRFTNIFLTNHTIIIIRHQIQQNFYCMWNEFYAKWVIEEKVIHDTDLEPFANQKARELYWNNFNASEPFITRFKREHGILSRRYNKLITGISSREKLVVWKVCKFSPEISIYLS